MHVYSIFAHPFYRTYSACGQTAGHERYKEYVVLRKMRISASDVCKGSGIQIIAYIVYSVRSVFFREEFLDDGFYFLWKCAGAAVAEIGIVEFSYQGDHIHHYLLGLLIFYSQAGFGRRIVSV